MSKALAGLPHEIWQNVLFNWLGNLAETVRIDCALSLASSNNPLCGVYIEKSLPLSRNAAAVSKNLITGLYSWLRSRKVYISSFLFVDCDAPLLPHCQDLISWSSDSLQSLHIKYSNNPYADPDTRYREEFLTILSWASCCIRKLQILNIELQWRASPASVESLMHNNAATLRSITIEDGTGRFEPFILRKSCPKFPELQVLKWNLSNLPDVLRSSPRLSAMFVLGGDSRGNAAVLSAIATLCPQLQRLHFLCFEGLTVAALLKIAHGCPLLEYFAIQWCHDFSTDRFADVVSALSYLHTLVLDDVDAATLLEIAASGHPSLRVLDAHTYFTYTGLRQLTASIPQLTRLSIYGINLLAASNTVNLLEHCQELEVLKLGIDTSIGTIEAVLESVAVHCPYLHTLIIGTEMHKHQMNTVSAVIEACPQLRLVCFDYPVEFVVPRYRAGQLKIVVKENSMELADWCPEWAK